MRFLNLVRPLARPSLPAPLGMSARIGARAFHFSRPTFSDVQKVEELVGYRASYVRPDAASLAPLKQAHELYAKIHVHNWDMLVTPGDIIKLPVRMRDVEIGNKLQFTEVSEIGSRNHTLSGGELGKGRIDPSIFNISGVVLEKSRVKRSVAQKTRRRRRHVRNVVSNNCLTVIRVSEVALK